ncbi:MAG: Bcr/CflA family drug resistance efflux transporter [Gammaproteobacteria bacterium CG11_big_fil_rev_8_21_14_0_20_46_22]|nr:MAG: Bcr/CflA family drug resistance efflux transporter [Gammaproteobacteria bacterium CG12_big_fil_rev_8_21_14_0_65_46_12]PIR10699.1 MAG: Bcr/CflA family drug resistance efflux transporter [Gammaproteobacteria bacterium CG11_big_fil_rev_8_21_14_0_20_46_22]
MNIITKPPLLLLLALLTTLAAVGQMCNTIYVPAMGQMATHFVVDPTHIQTVMAAYLLSYGLSQFFYGPLSDIFGRRPTILFGLIIFAVGSAIAAASNVLSTLLIGSLIQGMGIGVGGVMARTVMRDLYSGRELHRVSSYISMALIVAPLIAPLIGGLLTASFNWRANFIFLLVFGLFVLWFQWFSFKETNPHLGELRASPKTLLKDHQEILLHRAFLGNMFCLLVTFAGVSVFEASCGVIFSKLLHLSPEVISVLFVIPLPFYLLGAYISGRCSHRFELPSIIRLGVLVLVISSAVMFYFAWEGYLSVSLVIAPVSVYMLGGGILFPAATAGALENFPRRAGTAGALLGGLQNLGAGAFTAISASLLQTSLRPLASLLFVLSLIAAVAYWGLLRSRR